MGNRSPNSSPGSPSRNDGDDSGNNHKETAKNSKNSMDYIGKVVSSKPVRYLTIGALVVTGLIFLPPILMNSMSNALFPFIPEEYRPLAMAAVSLASCCSFSIIGCCILMNMAK